ncbi:uncharacterized protein LOC133519699 [Cydia pomonella]|uniref:uncharacterized protein LOC133519699 n=1 Tax=Cydia pomonella TaxID=82600 RepID=UPI002ADE91FA|nr:uncharacterized protein LOC133519699 [Cydia pomonella]
MRTIVVVAVIVALVAVCSIRADGYQIAVPDTELINDAPLSTLFREKRQVESFDDDDLSAPQQQEPEEPGFWDRVVKIAVKLFARFVEWLNS